MNLSVSYPHAFGSKVVIPYLPNQNFLVNSNSPEMRKKLPNVQQAVEDLSRNENNDVVFLQGIDNCSNYIQMTVFEDNNETVRIGRGGTHSSADIVSEYERVKDSMYEYSKEEFQKKNPFFDYMF